MSPLYAYIRVSTVKQGEKGSSLQEQRAAIDAYARRHSLTISEWFEETETAAKRGRHEFNRMLRALAHGHAAGVVIHKVDRGARNLRDWADLGELIDRGVEVHFAHENLDLTSRSGRLSADIQAVVAADFIRNLRDEVRKGFRGRLKQGLYPLPAPIGYRDQGRGLPKVPDPVTAPLVRQAFDLYASGTYNLHTLRDELHRRGLRNRHGGRVSLTGISTILNNPFYIGIISIKRTKETFHGVHEPLIPKSLFDRVQARLAGKIKNRGLKHHYAYRRFINCSTCKYHIIGERQKGHIYYRCHTAGCPSVCIREERVEQAFSEALRYIALASEDISDLEAKIDALFENRSKERGNLLEGIKLQIAQLDDRVIRLTDAYIDRVIEKDLFNDRMEKERQTRPDLVRAALWRYLSKRPRSECTHSRFQFRYESERRGRGMAHAADWAGGKWIGRSVVWPS